MRFGKIVVLLVILILISLIFAEMFCQCKVSLVYKSKSHICMSCRLKKLIGFLKSFGCIMYLFSFSPKIMLFKLRDGSLHFQNSKFPVLLKVRMNQ